MGQMSSSDESVCPHQKGRLQLKIAAKQRKQLKDGVLLKAGLRGRFAEEKRALGLSHFNPQHEGA